MRSLAMTTVGVLRLKLKILERTLRLDGLREEMAAELERCRLATARQLAQYESA